MSRPLLGFFIVLTGLLFAFLNKQLAKTGIEIREKFRGPTLSLTFARVLLVFGGLVFALVGLLVMLDFFP